MAFDLSDQKNQLMLLGIMGGVGLLYVWFTYLDEPRAARIGELEEQLTALQSEIGTLRVEAAQLPRVQEQYTEVQGRWDQLLTSFPSQAREEEVLANVTSSQSRAGLFITSFNKGESRQRELYVEQDYNVNLVGRYHELGTFIAEIAAPTPPRRTTAPNRPPPPRPRAGGGPGGDGPQAREDELYIVCTLRTYTVPQGG